jgi:hypothetical protein
MDNGHRKLYVNTKGFVFDYQTGLIYQLNPTGTLVLRRLLERTPLAEIRRTLKNEYHIDSRTAISDLDDFLRQLSGLNLLSPEEFPADD